MKCPHCLVSFHDHWTQWFNERGGVERRRFYQDCQGIFIFKTTVCPTCERIICAVERTSLHKRTGEKPLRIIAYPKATARPVPPAVEAAFANDFKEACLVIGDSEKASAALSRRCLQNLLREKAETKERDLAAQIQEVLASGKLPSHLAEAIDGVRVIGNFGAHPIKSKHTGEVIDVEKGEAEWLLETLEGLFDFYFVQPAKLKVKRAALNKKLEEAGKPHLKP